MDEERVAAGRHLRDKREAAGIPKALMAYLIDADPKTIDNYESGATKASGAVKFAYDNIELLLKQSDVRKPHSSCNAGYRFELPKLFDDSPFTRTAAHQQSFETRPLALLRKAS